MYYSYLIDPEYFPKDSDTEIQQKTKAINKLFKDIDFRSAWVDCSDMGMYNQIAKIFFAFKDSKKIPDRTKSTLMAIWTQYLFGKAYELKNTSCQCSHPNCEVSENYCSINNVSNYFPHFVISEKEVDYSITLNNNNCNELSIYKAMSQNRAWKNQIPYDNNKAKYIFQDGFIAALFCNKKKVTLYDRNIWPYWGDDIKNGLLSFIELFEICGIKDLTIITGYRKKHYLTENTNDHDIHRHITDFLNNELPDGMNVDIIVSESIQHYRFIKIDDLVCMDLDNGVSTFNPPKSITEIKRFKVDYKPSNEYTVELDEAINNKLDEFSISKS